MTISVPNGMTVAPPRQPDPCHKCGEPVYGKGESGYYDLCDDCTDTDT